MERRGPLAASARGPPHAGRLDPLKMALLHELEDEDVRSGVYGAFDGASELLRGLPPGRGRW